MDGTLWEGGLKDDSAASCGECTACRGPGSWPEAMRMIRRTSKLPTPATGGSLYARNPPFPKEIKIHTDFGR